MSNPQVGGAHVADGCPPLQDKVLLRATLALRLRRLPLSEGSRLRRQNRRASGSSILPHTLRLGWPSACPDPRPYPDKTGLFSGVLGQKGWPDLGPYHGAPGKNVGPYGKKNLNKSRLLDKE
jgi:hypothetical protein